MQRLEEHEGIVVTVGREEAIDPTDEKCLRIKRCTDGWLFPFSFRGILTPTIDRIRPFQKVVFIVEGRGREARATWIRRLPWPPNPEWRECVEEIERRDRENVWEKGVVVAWHGRYTDNTGNRRGFYGLLQNGGPRRVLFSGKDFIFRDVRDSQDTLKVKEGTTLFYRLDPDSSPEKPKTIEVVCLERLSDLPPTHPICRREHR